MSIVSQIPLHTIPGFSRLVADYLTGKQELKHLYKYDPNIDSFAQIMADKANDKTDRELLVSVLKKQYEGIETSGLTKRNIDSLTSPKTFTITAAHQPCLLLGPVFNIYKISSAIHLARQLKEKYPANDFVPVFWMGSEDHDFDELGNTFIYGKKLEWPAAAGEGGAYGRRRLNGLDKVLDDALAITGDAGKPLIDKLREGLSKSDTFGQYTRYLINMLFGDYGLVVIDQDDAVLKKKFSTVILDELRNSSSIKAIEENIKWLNHNYTAQAAPREINLFLLGENSRERIVKTEEDYFINNTTQRFPYAVLEKMAVKQPELFSPNVILRPVYQELILPNLAFIGGAGELSYWLELKPVFDHHHVNYPMLIERISMTVLNNSDERKLNKSGLSVIDFFGNIDQVISNFVKSKLSADIRFDTEKQSLEQLFATMAAKAEKVDPTLKATVLAEKQKQLNSLEGLEGRIVKAEKRKQEESIAQIRAIHQVICPNQSWQERVENFIPFYLRDPDYIRHIIDAADPFTISMLVINQDR